MNAQTHVVEAAPLGSVELPGAMNYHHDIDSSLSSGANAAGNALATILKMAEGINHARKAADPTITRAAYLARIEKAVGAFEREATAKLTQARKAINASLAESESKLANTVGISPTANAAEIRSILRTMPADKRQTELARAFADGNKEIIGAVVGFDQLMHGCAPESVAAQYNEYQRRIAPKEYASVEAHRKYASYLENAGPSLMAFTARALGGTAGFEKAREMTASVLKSYGIEFEA